MIVEGRAQELVSSPPPTSRLDVLGRTQALLLYQIIRLFDGDIRARAAAEEANPALEAAGTALLGHITFDHPQLPPTEIIDEPVVFSTLGQTREIWNEWVFQESARRTFFIAFFVVQTYRVLTGRPPLQCDSRLHLCHFWTLSAHLWHATDPLSFEIAWKEKNHLLVTNQKQVLYPGVDV